MNENGYVTCHLKGGLGNQLFQICTTLSYARRTKRQLVFHNRDAIGNRPAYFSSFFSGLQQYFVSESDFHELFHEGRGFVYDERVFEYVPILEYPPNVNVILNGYFQTDKYFKQDWPWIADTLWGSRREEYISCALPLLRHLPLPVSEGHMDSSVITIGLHFRIGDYVHIQHCHPVMNVDYYIRALENGLKELETMGGYGKQVEVLYFCEDFDLGDVMEKIQRLQVEFSSVTFRRAVVGMRINEDVKDKDWREMILFGMCDMYVIPNSSFSWWGAYLGSYFGVGAVSEGYEKVRKPVYYPSVWFGPGLHWNNVKDLCPENWHKIQA
jgi:hypothetical protein